MHGELMVPMLDWLRGGCSIFGQTHMVVRNDIDDPADTPVLVHRKVGLKDNLHITGPNCLCSPVLRRKCEVDSSAFKYEVSTLNGGFH